MYVWLYSVYIFIMTRITKIIDREAGLGVNVYLFAVIVESVRTRFNQTVCPTWIGWSCREPTPVGRTAPCDRRFSPATKWGGRTRSRIRPRGSRWTWIRARGPARRCAWLFWTVWRPTTGAIVPRSPSPGTARSRPVVPSTTARGTVRLRAGRPATGSRTLARRTWAVRTPPLWTTTAVGPRAGRAASTAPVRTCASVRLRTVSDYRSTPRYRCCPCPFARRTATGWSSPSCPSPCTLPRSRRWQSDRE